MIRNDERRPAGIRAASNEFSGGRPSALSVPAITDSALPRVIADSRFVIAASGQPRTVLLAHCPYCEDDHQHTGGPSFTSGRRKALCGLGSYVVWARQGGDV